MLFYIANVEYEMDGVSLIYPPTVVKERQKVVAVGMQSRNLTNWQGHLGRRFKRGKKEGGSIIRGDMTKRIERAETEEREDTYDITKSNGRRKSQI